MVLFDFHLADQAKDVNGVQLGGRSQVITNPEKRQSFLDNALKPLLEKVQQESQHYRLGSDEQARRSHVHPQWSMGWRTSQRRRDASLLSDVVRYIHTYSSQYATLGSASREWLGYWTSSKLDFYQYHYYDKMEDKYPLDYPYVNLGLDKPCVVGRLPTKNTKRTIVSAVPGRHLEEWLRRSFGLELPGTG